MPKKNNMFPENKTNERKINLSPRAKLQHFYKWRIAYKIAFLMQYLFSQLEPCDKKQSLNPSKIISVENLTL